MAMSSTVLDPVHSVLQALHSLAGNGVGSVGGWGGEGRAVG